MIDGGPVTLVYGFIFCWLGALVTAASLAEMVSMYEIPVLTPGFNTLVLNNRRI